ncbi:MAG: hypothetical protein MUE44_27150 [Oscillatoriaceae cyanobacterium Prado104]|nr:hypothetical protein [Oscillatoriaceae cyanobacterium Prado104]
MSPTPKSQKASFILSGAGILGLNRFEGSMAQHHSLSQIEQQLIIDSGFDVSIARRLRL